MNKGEILPVNEIRITPNWMHFLEVFIGADGNQFAIKLEESIETNLIKILQELGVQASVKSDRYSLPVQGFVSSSAGQSSYVNDIYDASDVKRNFIKNILIEDCRKVRFYVYVYTTDLEGATGLRSMLGRKFNIEIRYFLH